MYIHLYPVKYRYKYLKVNKHMYTVHCTVYTDISSTLQIQILKGKQTSYTVHCRKCTVHQYIQYSTDKYLKVNKHMYSVHCTLYTNISTTVQIQILKSKQTYVHCTLHTNISSTVQIQILFFFRP